MAGPPAKAAAPGSLESYQILTDRNIFMRNRGRQFNRGPQRPAPPENPDDRIVLTGIIQQGADGVAFFEDTRSRKTIRIQAGDAVGRGRVTAVSLDEVQYACEGTTTKVAIGNNLTGRATVLSSPPPPPSSAAATPMAGTRSFGPPMAGPPAGGMGGPGGPAAGSPAAAMPTVIVVAPSESAGDEPDSETASDSTEPTPAAAGNPMDNSASILERMRQRREQELQK